MELIVSKTLLYGVLLSTAVIIIGLVMMSITNSTGYSCDSLGDVQSCLLSFNLFSSPSYPFTLGSIYAGLLELKPFAVIQLGVLVLLATPVIRVATTLVLFANEHDRNFILITLFVLLVLLFSLFIAPAIPLFRA